MADESMPRGWTVVMDELQMNEDSLRKWGRGRQSRNINSKAAPAVRGGGKGVLSSPESWKR